MDKSDPNGFGQGEQISGTNYFFARDHLGSIREMTDNAATVRARYDYDPHGRKMLVSGDLDPDSSFTGDYSHKPSGLYLTLFRAYDSDLGRWLSRDPVGESVGMNLYDYVLNNPAALVDALGLDPGTKFGVFEDAVKDALAYMWQHPAAPKYEKLTTILYDIEEDNFYYPEPKQGEDEYYHKYDPWLYARLQDVPFAHCHSHPMSDFFSRDDMMNAENSPSFWEYVLTPGGQAVLYIPGMKGSVWSPVEQGKKTFLGPKPWPLVPDNRYFFP